jgi:pyridoxamine 5'-phosphate oxidase
VDLGDDPITVFGEWYRWASEQGIPDPDAVVLATADERGRPSARHVLFRGAADRDFRFFTNYRSRKADQLEANPRAALVFPWSTIGRQVTVEGDVERLRAEESDAYWVTRPRGSQLAARASDQSQVLPDRADLERRFTEEEARWEGQDVERPDHWGGYRVRPDRFEFWEGRPNRLHDRVLYLPDGDGWSHRRLYP